MKRKGLLIDLTSLLDVILIVLFLVLTTSAAQAATATEDIEAINQELSQANQALSEQVEALERRQFEGTPTEQNWYQVYREQIGRIEVYFPDDLQTEAMRLIEPDGTEKKKPETDNLADWLQEAIDDIDQEVIIITFSYRNDAIFWRDYTGLRDILLRISGSSNKTIFYEEVPRK